MVDTELLIFSLISLIILIPIIYFLPLNLTKKGKMTVIAVSFLIALAGLLTKVFMELWQSILLLVGLILLLSMVLTKKYSTALFPMPGSPSKGMPIDEDEKDKEISNVTRLESLPVIHENEMKENPGIKNEQLELEKMNSNLNVDLNDEEYRVNELEELYAFESNEYKGNEFIYPSEDALSSPSLESTSDNEKDEASSLSEMELEEVEELEPLALAKQAEAENEAIPTSCASSYLGELEELMLESQTESAAAVELLDVPKTETDPLSEVEGVISLNDESDIESMLNNQLIEETERAEEPSQEVVAEEETLQICAEEYPVLNELSDEDLQAVFNEEVESEEIIAEEPVVEMVPLDTIEDFQPAVNVEERDVKLPIHESANDELEHNILSSEEQWNQMETSEGVLEVAQETEVPPEESPAQKEDDSKTFEHKEVFETLLLQAEIAKKMQNKEQFEQIVASFLNYEDSEDERYKMLKVLLKDYINIMK
mgnify:CR=1 FL=1